MKAIRAHSFGGTEVLQLDVVDDPVPGPGEVVIDVRAADAMLWVFPLTCLAYGVVKVVVSRRYS